MKSYIIEDFLKTVDSDIKLKKNFEKLIEKYKNSCSSKEQSVEFLTKELIPFAHETGFNFELQDYIDYFKTLNRELSDEELSEVSGGINRRTLASLGLFVTGFSTFGSGAGSVKESKATNLSYSDYNAQSANTAEQKALARQAGTYPTKEQKAARARGEDVGEFTYGYGNYDHQEGDLDLSGVDPEKIITPPEQGNYFLYGGLLKGDTYTYSKEAPLFRNEPDYHDILQNLAGNCYFEAVLISALRSPGGEQKILNIMKDTKDGFVVVKLIGKDGTPGYFRVAKDTIKYDGEKVLNGVDHIIWPQILQKAYALAQQYENFHYQNKSFKKGSYLDIHGGCEENIYKCIFGLDSFTTRSINTVSNPDYFKYFLQNQEYKQMLIQNMQESLKEGFPVSVSLCIDGGYHGVVVKSFNEKTGEVRVVDPHGTKYSLNLFAPDEKKFIRNIIFTNKFSAGFKDICLSIEKINNFFYQKSKVDNPVEAKGWAEVYFENESPDFFKVLLEITSKQEPVIIDKENAKTMYKVLEEFAKEKLGMAGVERTIQQQEAQNDSL